MQVIEFLKLVRNVPYWDRTPGISDAEIDYLIEQIELEFRTERTPVDDKEAITRLIIEAGSVFNPKAVARYLVQNGVRMKG